MRRKTGDFLGDGVVVCGLVSFVTVSDSNNLNSVDYGQKSRAGDAFFSVFSVQSVGVRTEIRDFCASASREEKRLLLTTEN